MVNQMALARDPSGDPPGNEVGVAFHIGDQIEHLTAAKGQNPFGVVLCHDG
jgi:hypothetical protein